MSLFRFEFGQCERRSASSPYAESRGGCDPTGFSVVYAEQKSGSSPLVFRQSIVEFRGFACRIHSTRHLRDCVFHGGFALGEGQACRVEERSEQGAGGFQRDAYFGAGKFIEQPPAASCRDNQALAA